MVCSCVSSRRLLMSNWNSALRVKNGRLLPWVVIWNKLGDWIKTITEHGYRKILWFVIVLPINYLFQLLAADKSQYFAQLRPIIVNYFLKEGNVTNSAIWMVLSAVRIFYLWPRLRWSFCEFLFFSLQDKERINNLFTGKGSVHIVKTCDLRLGIAAQGCKCCLLLLK